MLIEANISKAVLHKNETEIPLLAASDGRIYMSASELHQMKKLHIIYQFSLTKRIYIVYAKYMEVRYAGSSSEMG